MKNWGGNPKLETLRWRDMREEGAIDGFYNHMNTQFLIVV